MAPQEVGEIGRMGRLTALKKPNGRIRGIVFGEVVRTLVSRTIAQQVSKAVEASTAPLQCALSTKAGRECVACALQALCELDPSSTVVSVDGIGHSTSFPPCCKDCAGLLHTSFPSSGSSMAPLPTIGGKTTRVPPTTYTRASKESKETP